MPGASEMGSLHTVQVKPERIHASPVNAVAQTLEQETGFRGCSLQALGFKGSGQKKWGSGLIGV